VLTELVHNGLARPSNSGSFGRDSHFSQRLCAVTDCVVVISGNPRRVRHRRASEKGRQQWPPSTQTSGAESGADLLRDPRLNKSTAFTESDRESYGLAGLLPSGVESRETQIHRVMQQLGDKPTDLERYIYLIALLDTRRDAVLRGRHVGAGALSSNPLRTHRRPSVPEGRMTPE
jgi:hypothetical protein